jgi:uncharacterized protein (TIGR02996 family)
MRTFQRGNDRFWTITRQGTTITVGFGKVGGKATSRKTVSRPASAARSLYQRMIRDKLREGYTETTPPQRELDVTGQALERAIVENPDDLSAHMAYADWLGEQPDPLLQARSEFIRVQLAMEKRRLAPADRSKLQRKANQLLAANESDWLGHRVADYLIEGGGSEDYLAVTEGEEAEREYRRGWLSKLELPYLCRSLAEAMADAPSLRLLRDLVIRDTSGSDDPLAPVAKAANLTNVRALTVQLGDFEGPVSDLVANLPRIEEIHLLAPGLALGSLFSLDNLEHLRVLQVVEAEHYPIRELANNPSLGKLETLLLIPPGLEDDDEPHLRLAAVRALVRSKHLAALKHLALHRSDMGDAGCREIADSGVLGRLETLDLTSGCISDEGARILASAKDFNHLRKLDLTGNRLTQVGIGALARKGLQLLTRTQQTPDEEGRYDDAYLYEEAYFAWMNGQGDAFDSDWE